MRRTRPSLLVSAASAATIAQGLEAWPLVARAVLAGTAVGLWLTTVIKRV